MPPLVLTRPKLRTYEKGQCFDALLLMAITLIEKLFRLPRQRMAKMPLVFHERTGRRVSMTDK